MDFIINIVVFGLFVLYMMRSAFRHDRREEQLENSQEYDKYFPLDYTEEDEYEEVVVRRRPPPPPTHQVRKVVPPPVVRVSHKVSVVPGKNVMPVTPNNATAYDIKPVQHSTRANHILNELPKLKNILIYHEIFGPPKALRDD